MTEQFGQLIRELRKNTSKIMLARKIAIFINKLRFIHYCKMTRKLKKEPMVIMLILILFIFLLMPLISADFRDVWNKITGAGTGPQSLGVAVQTNAVPIIGNVTAYSTPISVTEAGNTS